MLPQMAGDSGCSVGERIGSGENTEEVSLMVQERGGIFEKVGARKAGIVNSCLNRSQEYLGDTCVYFKTLLAYRKDPIFVVHVLNDSDWRYGLMNFQFRPEGGSVV